MRADELFAYLQRTILKPKAREAQKNACISVATWRLANEKVSACQDPVRDQALIQRLG